MLGYKVQNSKEAKEGVVIFLHGMGGISDRAFKKQMDDFGKNYDLLFIDLHGHGKSTNMPLHQMENFSYPQVAKDVLEVLDYLGIEKAHFVGLSLGTMLIQVLAAIAPERMESIIMSGPVLGFRWKMQALFKLGNLLKTLNPPYMWLYRSFSLIMMPKKHHQFSRNVFVDCAKKIGQAEFFAWFELLQEFEEKYPLTNFAKNNIPKLLVSGLEDHMFAGLVRQYKDIDKSAEVVFVSKCGHIVNIERPQEFNSASISFLESIKNAEKSA